MTSRQARKLRREEERQAKKAAYKAGLQLAPVPAVAPERADKHGLQAAAPLPPATDLPFDDEFSPALIAEANAMRERIERRLAAARPEATPRSAPPAPHRAPRSEPPATTSRAAINRANAAHSTGPLSPEGKLASSRNSLKHGLAAGTLIIPGEDPAVYEALLETLLAEHQPANAAESLLIHEMAQSWWLVQRALRLQNECFTADTVNEKRLGLFLRYHATHERAFHKALNALMRLRKERCRARPQPCPPIHEEHGFVSQPPSSLRNQSGFVSRNRSQAAPEPGFVSQNTAPPRPAEAA
ncbi:MAG: hypothetical protein JO340_13570 [Acidobacteriaceae bacterium]|nr:hypothetical protein [Acidobacteriaceae bacterium]